MQQTLYRQNLTQSRKKNLWTQMINQSKWQLKHLKKIFFLPHVSTLTRIQFFLSHPNQTHCKKSRRLLESAVISKTNHIKQHLGFYQISPYPANIILNKIKIANIILKKTFFHSVPPYFWESFPFPFHYISRYLSI